MDKKTVNTVLSSRLASMDPAFGSAMLGELIVDAIKNFRNK